MIFKCIHFFLNNICSITDSALEKLSAMTDADFAALELYPDFDDKEDADAE